MRQDLYGELVAFLERHLWFPTNANSCGSSSDNDGSWSEGRSLRKEADDLRNGEDQVAEHELEQSMQSELAGLTNERTQHLRPAGLGLHS